jgi:ABC-type multidrug transport system ATPase subunit
VALHGCTVIFSIHQPRFAIYKLLDRLYLLAAGRTVYHGPAEEALDFFRETGQQFVLLYTKQRQSPFRNENRCILVAGLNKKGSLFTL